MGVAEGNHGNRRSGVKLKSVNEDLLLSVERDE